MTTTTPDLHVRLFGQVTVRVGDATVTPPPGKPATAFAALALAAGEVVRTRTLIDALWGDEPPQSARALVHTHVSALRRALTSGEVPAPLPETVPGGYRLALDPEQVDVLRFMRMSVDDLTDEEIAAALRVSSAPVLSGTDNDFGESWRIRVSAQRTLLQHRAWTLRIGNGESVAVLPDLRAAVRSDPLWEGGVLLLAQALDETGRREEALSTLDRYRRQMAEELGLDPSPRMTQEHQRLLRGRPPADPPPGRPVPAAVPIVVEAPEPAGVRELDHQSLRGARAVRRRLVVAVLVAAAALGAWWSLTTREAAVPAPGGPALLFFDPQVRGVLDTIELPVDPERIELDDGRLWVSSTSDRAIAHLDVDGRQSIRVVGLAQPPTSLAVAAGVATVGLGFSGHFVTIADGRAGPSQPLQEGKDGRLTLASREGATWAATIDGELVGPGLANPSALQRRVGGVPMRMAMDRDRAWVLTIDRRELVAVPLAGGEPVVSVLRGEPIDIAAADGGAWAVSSGDHRLWRATAAQGRVIATRPLPGQPAGVTVGTGVVWVAVVRPAMLIGYDPETLQEMRSVNLPREPVDVAAEGDLVVVAVR